MTYEVIILGHLHMPLYFIGTFTEYPFLNSYTIIEDAVSFWSNASIVLLYW